MTFETPITNESVTIAILVLAITVLVGFIIGLLGKRVTTERIALYYSRSKTKTKPKPIHKTKPCYLDSIELEELEDSEDEEELDFPIIDEWEDEEDS